MRYEDEQRTGTFRVYFDMAMIIALSIIGLWAATQTRTQAFLKFHEQNVQEQVGTASEHLQRLESQAARLHEFLTDMKIPHKYQPAVLPLISIDKKKNSNEDVLARVKRKTEAFDDIFRNMGSAQQHQGELWEKAEPLLKPITIVIGEETLRFLSGSDRITDLNSDDTLEEIKEQAWGWLQQGFNTIQVEGHTDNEPIRNNRFRDNWDLSVARAVRIAREVDTYLSQKHKLKRGSDYIVVAAGFAEHQPVMSNDTPEGKKKNRRIQITYLYRPLTQETK